MWKPARGSILWRIGVQPIRLLKMGPRYLTASAGYLRLAWTGAGKPRRQTLKPGAVTILVVSAGRRAYLQRTLESLRRHLRDAAPSTRWLLIDDDPTSIETRQYIAGLEGFRDIVLHTSNRGLGYSLNDAYRRVTTEFTFHCEDDWEFLRTFSLQGMIATLRAHPEWRQLLLFREPIHEREYCGARAVADDLAELSEKYSFNPHLTRTALVLRHMPFPLACTELDFTLKLERAGERVSGVLGYGDAPYVRHLGIERRVAWV